MLARGSRESMRSVGGIETGGFLFAAPALKRFNWNVLVIPIRSDRPLRNATDVFQHLSLQGQPTFVNHAPTHASVLFSIRSLRGDHPAPPWALDRCGASSMPSRVTQVW